MKRLLPLLLLILATVGCKSPIATLYAQTVPVTIAADLTPNPPAQNVSSYKVVLDGAVINTVPATACPGPGVCTVTFQVGSFGVHSLTYIATNLELSGDGTSAQDSAPSPAKAFTLNQSPTTPTVAPGVHK